MKLDREGILAVLGEVVVPGFRRDVVSAGFVGDVAVEGGRLRVSLDLPPGNEAIAEALQREIHARLSALEGVESVELRRRGEQRPEGLKMVSSQQAAGPNAPRPTADGGLDAAAVPGIRSIVAVASGKGGVGKSTIAVNLAVALARQGRSVGLLDADIYGPSIPLMLGVDERPRLDESGERLLPFERYGLRFISIGLLVDKDQAVIWRGPMVMKALEQLLRQVVWGELDVLVVDMPPGTGDAQLTLSQRVRLAGAVIVTTPQDVALADAIKGEAMFRRVGVPVLGLVENMSFFACPHCGERSEIFGHDGGRQQADRLNIPFLGRVPLDPQLTKSADEGQPFVDRFPEHPLTGIFLEIAERIGEACAEDGADAPRADGLFQRLKEAWQRGDADR